MTIHVGYCQHFIFKILDYYHYLLTDPRTTYYSVLTTYGIIIIVQQY